jgi:hypothetical protein
MTAIETGVRGDQRDGPPLRQHRVLPSVFRRGRQWLQALLKSTGRLSVLVAISLAAAEATARMDDFLRYGIAFTNVPNETRDLIVQDSLGIHGRPEGRYRWWHLNAYGFRAPEMSRMPRPGCTRVMVMGASETFGLYESPGMDYPAQLQGLLAAHGCYEVVNAAVVGASLRSMLGLWRKWVAPFQPHVVVVYPNPSFYLRTEPPGAIAPGDPQEAVRHASPPWWTPRLIDRVHRVFHYPDAWQRRRVAKWLAQALAGHDASWPYQTIPDDRLTAFDADLDSLVRAIRAEGAVAVLVTHGMPFGMTIRPGDVDLLQAWRRYYPRATPEILLAFDSACAAHTRQFAADEHVSVADVAARLNGRGADFADFTHFTDRGAYVVAELLATAILPADVRSTTTAPMAAAGEVGPGHTMNGPSR